ncbi:MsnO8 family LLM class oxidoreductase [Nonomuraea sp. NPDC050540]|uniref:MsnO8 family LLM class oxidoreductase n=1 Tax=Nonomuraea sp. NPDC050540 TaxID=3364367 RepID=UPI003792B894
MTSIKISALELAVAWEGRDAGQALRAVVEDARRLDRLGAHRLWVAEHHNSVVISSSSPAVLVSRIAAATSRIRVGSGGVMLNNHAPLAVAEQFATLEALFPGRIDLGMGRASGTDPDTARMLRQGRPMDRDEFESRLVEVRSLLRNSAGVTPRLDHAPAMYVLGGSPATAELAGRLGLGLALAHHLGGAPLEPAIAKYRECFEPGHGEPHVIASVTLVLADTAREGARLYDAVLRMTVDASRGGTAGLRRPVPGMCDDLTEEERRAGAEYAAAQLVGGPDEAREGLRRLAAAGVDEVMGLATIVDDQARMNSYAVALAAAGQGPPP